MSYYCVQSRSQAGPIRTYWVQAKSAALARTLVALNVAAAVDARDETLFDCIQDDTRKPPAGLIYSDTERPIAIKVSG
jgi:hypothetical protein